jgi:hypothetical protein
MSRPSNIKIQKAGAVELGNAQLGSPASYLERLAVSRPEEIPDASLRRPSICTHASASAYADPYKLSIDLHIAWQNPCDATGAGGSGPESRGIMRNVKRA